MNEWCKGCASWNMGGIPGAFGVHCGSTAEEHRAVYTVRFTERLSVRHTFQKKSRHGITTPPQEMALIRSRLRWAQEEHETWLAQEKHDER